MTRAPRLTPRAGRILRGLRRDMEEAEARVGKNRAGAMLDGYEWREMPA